jgi:hypothetical protein
MHRRSLLITLTLAAIAALGTISSTASAKGKEHAVKTRTKFTASYGGGEYFGPENTLNCKGVHKTNSLRYPGSGNKGGEDIEHCTLSRGETFPARWQTPGQPINIDDNFWGSDFDGQEVPFNEDLPAYGVFFSEVSAGDNSFTIKVLYPDS